MTDQVLDDRWIVREMGEEGKNVGHWHWTERNCLPWAEKKLSKLFENHITQTPQFRSKIIFEKISGDCLVMNRKGKFIAVYEVKIEFKWNSENFPKQGEELIKTSGKMTIPYIGEESDLGEYSLKFELDDSNKLSKHEAQKSLVEKFTEKEVKSKVNEFIKELREGADYKDLLKPSQHTISPFEDEKFKNVAEKNIINESVEVTNSSILSNVLKSQPVSTTGAKKQSLKIHEVFKTSPEVIFQSFIDPRRIAAYTQSKPCVDAKVGGKVDYYNGKLVGAITKIASNRLLSFSVRMSDWKSDDFSTVDLEFEKKDNSTKVTLSQTSIPEKDKNGGNIAVKSIENFWREMFLNRINLMFASGFRF